MAMAGAELLIYPTAIGWDPRDEAEEQSRQREAWITVQRGHAVANGVPVVSVNRVGHEGDPGAGSASDPDKTAPGTQFWGSSFVAGPQGEFLFQAEVETEQVAVVDVDMARSESVRRIWPFLRDRRIDHYTDITKILRD